MIKENPNDNNDKYIYCDECDTPIVKVPPSLTAQEIFCLCDTCYQKGLEEMDE